MKRSCEFLKKREIQSRVILILWGGRHASSALGQLNGVTSLSLLMCRDLEIDVNGQEKFFVDKEILASFSGRLRKLLGKLRGKTGRLKVIFHDFPGGAAAFELISKYCYNGGKININPSSLLSLHFAAIFMEMNENSNGRSCLISQTRAEYLKRIHQWAWSELLDCLKQCQELLLPVMESSYMLQELLDCLVGKLSWLYISAPDTSSSEYSCVQFSGDISTERTSNCSSQTGSMCWFGNFDFLNIDLFEKVVETMVAQKLDNFVISSFIFHYQKFKFRGAPPAQKRKIIETSINLLYLLNRSLIPVRGLFHILQRSLSSEVKISRVKRIESLIASLLDRATLDDLLFPSPFGKSYAYDVNLILRLQKQFLIQECSNHFVMYRVKKAALLIDLYLAEVAPDPNLTPSKFVALAVTLPDFARDSHDMIYEAMDVYLKVHKNLRQEEKIKLCCCVLNYDKLSARSLIHLARNSTFPDCAKVTAAVSQHSNCTVLAEKTAHHAIITGLKSCNSEGGVKGNNNLEDQLVYMNKLDHQATEGSYRKPRSIEKVGRKKQTRAANIVKLSSSTIHYPC